MKSSHLWDNGGGGEQWDINRSETPFNAEVHYHFFSSPLLNYNAVTNWAQTASFFLGRYHKQHHVFMENV